MKTQFPQTIEAVERREKHRGDLDGKDLWAIGDALIADCGTFDKLYARVRIVAAELKRLGYRDYHQRYLGELAETANAFPKNRRHADISFTTHREAGGPDFLDWAVEEMGSQISFRQVLKLRKRWQLLERKQRKQRLEQAKETERKAQTPADKARARERVRELDVMPDPLPRQLPAPDKGAVAEMRDLATVLDLELDAKIMNKDLAITLKTLRGHLSTIDAKRDQIDQDFIDSMEGHYQALAETTKEIMEVTAQIAGRLGSTKLKRFTSIAGGKAS